MMPVTDEKDAIPKSAALLFMPVDKRAFGAAIGTAGAVLLAAVTLAVVAMGHADVATGLGLLSNYFSGYSVSVMGAIIGALWAFAVGFVVGWLIAFTRNLSLAVSLFLLRSRAELGETSDFLDHI
jgi:hypothetical protein